jgi:hypothetical protein
MFSYAKSEPVTIATEMSENCVSYKIENKAGVGWVRISPNEVGYVGVQYINAGTLKYKDEERTLPGINLMMGGNHYFGYSRFFMDWSINLSFLFRDDVVGGMIGVSLGLGCEL